MRKEAFVDSMASATNSTLDIGVTNHLLRRVDEHNSRSTWGFTAKYHCTQIDRESKPGGILALKLA